MKDQILVKRYAQGLVDSIKNHKEFTRISKELEEFNQLVRTSEELGDVLFKPFVPNSKAKKIAEKLLKRSKDDPKTIRFISLLIDNERISKLDDILKEMPDAWNEKKGIITLEVSSVIPLKQDQKKRLKKKLEKIKNNPVSLKYKIDKSLLGGLSIRQENTFFDVSIRGGLMKLEEKIKQG
ncbi:MAG: ATP synthase F1 subunit delta [Candidatus Aminicenantes bacterium]|nr:ATP synthase F1 subunit delta [Candidatus Aminicenantes bacterium]